MSAAADGLNYEPLHAFAEKHRVSYNELCVAVRAAQPLPVQRLVTLNSASRAINHVSIHNGPGRLAEATAMLVEVAAGRADAQPAEKLDAEAAQPATERKPLTDDERVELERLRRLVNTPELLSFRDGVVLESAHQRERWGGEHDAGKTPADWFWLVGYLAGKALHAQTSGNTDKALHHTISTAAALANWHAAITGEHSAMRPGIDPAANGIAATQEKP